MPKKTPPTIAEAEARHDAALIAAAKIKSARDDLRKVGCKSAADYAQKALKSAEGAVRHAQRLCSEARACPGRF